MIFEAGSGGREGGIPLLVILPLMLEQNENPSDPGERDNSDIVNNNNNYIIIIIRRRRRYVLH